MQDAHVRLDGPPAGPEMRRGRGLVEINPRINGRLRDHFERLARGCGLAYQPIVQRGAFAEVPLERVVEAVRLVL